MKVSPAVRTEARNWVENHYFDLLLRTKAPELSAEAQVFLITRMRRALCLPRGESMVQVGQRMVSEKDVRIAIERGVSQALQEICTKTQALKPVGARK